MSSFQKFESNELQYHDYIRTFRASDYYPNIFPGMYMPILVSAYREFPLFNYDDRENEVSPMLPVCVHTLVKHSHVLLFGSGPTV